MTTKPVAVANDLSSPDRQFPDGDCRGCDWRGSVGPMPTNKITLRDGTWKVIEVPRPSIIKPLGTPSAPLLIHPGRIPPDDARAYSDGLDAFLHAPGRYAVCYKPGDGSKLGYLVVDAYHVADSGLYRRNSFSGEESAVVTVSNITPTLIVAANARRRSVSLFNLHATRNVMLWRDTSVSSVKGTPLFSLTVPTLAERHYSESSPLGLSVQAIYGLALGGNADVQYVERV